MLINDYVQMKQLEEEIFLKIKGVKVACDDLYWKTRRKKFLEILNLSVYISKGITDIQAEKFGCTLR